MKKWLTIYVVMFFCTIASLEASQEERMFFNLDENDIKQVHREVIQKHLNFKAKYPRESFSNRLSEWWLCNKMRYQWTEFEELFPSDVEDVEMPDSIDKVLDNYEINIYLSTYTHFAPYEDSIIEFDRPRVINDVGVFYHDYERKFKPQKVWYSNNGKDSTAYYLYSFRDEIFGIRGNILISEERPKKIKFLSGPVLPLINHTSWITKELIFPRAVRKSIYEDFWQKKQNKGKISENISFDRLHGISTYSRILIHNFTLGKSSIVKEKNGIFLLKSETRIRDRYSPCKHKPFPNRNAFNFDSRFTSTNQIYETLCNNYNGRIVTELYIKINPETGDVAFKIGDRTSIRRMPECKNLKE